MSADERIEELLQKMSSQKRLFLRLIAFCEEEKSAEEMDEYTEQLKQNCYSVYSPVIMRELLEEAGAIRYIGAEVEADAHDEADAHGGECACDEAGSQDEADAQDVAGARGGADAQDKMDTSANLGRSVVEDGALIAIDEADIKHEKLIEDNQELTLDYLEIEEEKPGFWIATSAGLAAVAKTDDVAATKELLEKEPVYLDIYHQILDFCASEEKGRSAKEIDNLVNNSPLLENPRRYSGYFVSRLERQGAIEWRSGWCITNAGKTIIDEYASKIA